MNLPLNTPLQCEKFYVEVTPETLQMISPLLRRKFEGGLPYERVFCIDKQTRTMLNIGWAFANKMDRAARRDPDCPRELRKVTDFVIWHRIQRKHSSTPAKILRKHGIFNEQELEERLRASGSVL